MWQRKKKLEIITQQSSGTQFNTWVTSCWRTLVSRNQTELDPVLRPRHSLPPDLWSYRLYCTWASSYSFYANTVLSSLLSLAERDSYTSSGLWHTHTCKHTHTHTHTHTQCHLESERGNSWMIFIVIHVLIYSLMADVKRGCNMQMWVCFSMGIFRSTASSCH